MVEVVVGNDAALDQVLATIAAHRFNYADEDELQQGIALAFAGAGIAFTREVRFSRTDRIDFLVDGAIGVEVKILGGASAVTRQLHRYACDPRIRALVLITDRAQLARQPLELAGKPLRVVSLLGGLR